MRNYASLFWQEVEYLQCSKASPHHHSHLTFYNYLRLFRKKEKIALVNDILKTVCDIEHSKSHNQVKL